MAAYCELGSDCTDCGKRLMKIDFDSSARARVKHLDTLNSINNLGDPFVSSNYGVHSREFERAVIDFFAGLWKIEKCQYWGYVTTCGTEGNLHAMLLARECQPNGVLYTSAETHYSIFKAARYYKIDCEAVPTLPMGEIDYDELGRRLAALHARGAGVVVRPPRAAVHLWRAAINR